MPCFILIAACSVAVATAQQRVSAAREDGHITPLLVYEAFPKTASCAPMALISHGAGGSESGYVYLAQGMAHLGYTAIVMGHLESGRDAVLSSIAANGRHDGIQDVVLDKAAETDRLLDVNAALAWSNAQCKAPFRILLGHSMGAETVMLEAGARSVLGIPTTLAGHDRFDAYVAMSPEGPGLVFADRAWANIRKPFLSITGTQDGSLRGGPTVRLAAWKDLPGTPAHCQWQGLFQGAVHADFGGRGPNAARIDPQVITTIASFLKGVRDKACTLPPPVDGLTLQAK